MSSKSSVLSVWSQGMPTSADPIDYDAFVHHIAFGSVFGTLVSNYKAGAYVGIIAESWLVDQQKMNWSFKIRSGLQYSNGDIISPNTVLYSLKRQFLLMKKRGSKSGVYEHINGIENLISLDSDIEGLYANDNSIEFKFSKPMPNLLDQLSFGLYGISHPSNYDKISGLWNKTSKIISSGPYQIDNWNEQQLSLKFRPDFMTSVGLDSRQRFKQITISWSETSRLEADLISGADIEDPFLEGFTFYGPNRSNILYLHCLSWWDPNSPLHDIETRRKMRTLFYKSLIEQDLAPSYSFFPLATRSVEQVSSNESILSQGSESIPDIEREISFLKHPLPFDTFNKIYEASSRSVAGDIKFPNKQWTLLINELNPYTKDYKIDMVAIVTGMLVEYPDEDIKFMVLSKEGIRLPDPTGRLKELTSVEKVHPQSINEQLWEDAIIWPVKHLSMGLWAKDSIDLKELNLSLPPTNFMWVLRK